MGRQSYKNKLDKHLMDLAEEMDILDTREFKKAINLMGQNNVKELLLRAKEDLEQVVVNNRIAIAEVTSKTQANMAYQQACNVRSEFQKALKDTVEPYRVAASLAVSVLRKKKNG